MEVVVVDATVAADAGAQASEWQGPDALVSPQYESHVESLIHEE